MKLNLGCGSKLIDGFENIDHTQLHPDVTVADIRDIGSLYEQNSIEEIRMIHVIEHFFKDEARDLLTQCFDILQFGGKIVIETPNLRKICEGYITKELDPKLVNELLLGFYISTGVRDRTIDMLHKYWYDERTIMHMMGFVGFKHITIEEAKSIHEFVVPMVATGYKKH